MESKTEVTFIGSSVARRLCSALPDHDNIRAVNKTVSGAGILSQNKGQDRNSVFVSLESFVNDKFVCLQYGGNDFFAHENCEHHIKNVRIFSNCHHKKRFSETINQFLCDFKGDIVWIIGILPRYLNIKCCPEHKLKEETTSKILKLVNDVNRDLQKKCNYFDKQHGKKVIFLDPNSLLPEPVLWENASDDQVHFSSSVNAHCAKVLLECISYHLEHR